MTGKATKWYHPVMSGSPENELVYRLSEMRGIGQVRAAAAQDAYVSLAKKLDPDQMDLVDQFQLHSGALERAVTNTEWLSVLFGLGLPLQTILLILDRKDELVRQRIEAEQNIKLL